MAAPTLAAVVAGCGTPEPRPALRLLVPNAPGGGYDTTARVLASALGRVVDDGPVDVFNLPGGGGVTGLARLRREAGHPDLLMMMGLGVVGAAAVAARADDLAATTPIARLLGEPDVVLVRHDSDMADFADLAREWQRRPRGVRVGGGSLPGGPDHLATYSLAGAIDVPVGAVRYRTYDGGGPLLAALLDGEVDVVFSGVLETIDQVRSGAVRALAVTGPNPVPSLPTPTLRELGVGGELENWRGLLAPPGLASGDAARLIGLVERAIGTAGWRAAVTTNGWTPRWLAGEEFADFLADERRRTTSLLDRMSRTRAGA
jgi:putative tricarboxylic transport membrane protein